MRVPSRENPGWMYARHPAARAPNWRKPCRIAGQLSPAISMRKKTEKIQTHAARLQLQSIKTRVQDATVRVEEWEKAFHGVLVDAPCSGLGLLRRKPDIKVHRKPEDIKELLVLQKDILRQAAQYVRPGGKLVYSTCTLLPDENEEQVRRFLAQHPDYVPDGKDFERRIDMTESGADGFYMARLRRK